MLYVYGKFYDGHGVECSYKEEGAFYIFSNGEKHFRFEIENKIFNFNTYESTKILNYVELERRRKLVQ